MVVTIDSISEGSYTALTVTALSGLASSATAGWQSDRIDNQTTTKALDYEIFIKIPMTTTAPANDKCVYVLVSAAMTSDGSNWLQADCGSTVLPTGTQGTITTASISTSVTNLKMLGILQVPTAAMVVQGSFLLSNAVGNYIPDGFSLILMNYSGAAVSSSSQSSIAYRAINVSNSS